MFCNSIMFMLGMSSACMFINFGLLAGSWLSLVLYFSFRTKIKGPSSEGVHQHQPVKQGQVPCMYVHSVYVLRGVFVWTWIRKTWWQFLRFRWGPPKQEKNLCETTSLAKHRGEWVNGSVGPQSHLMSKPTECEYGYRTHSGTRIKLRSTRWCSRVCSCTHHLEKGTKS